ncbi:MAG: universal stress protein [Phycisphaerales bacterium]
MTTEHPIIVGVDFSPGSRSALEQAVRIAKLTGRPIRAAHVIDRLVLEDLQEAVPALAPTLEADLVADARTAWARLTAGLADARGVEIDVVIEHLLAGMLRLAGTAAGTLLVLGASGERAPDVGPGTLATACVRKSPANVLLVRSNHVGPFRRIVAAIDFSATSLRALERAATFAAMDRAELRVVHIFSAPWRVLHYRAPTPEIDPDFQRQYRDALERRLRGAATDACAAHPGLTPICELVDDDHHRGAIAEHATRVKADLLVLGTRGRTNLRDILIGSTAERTLETASCSVLAVKPAGFTHPLAEPAPVRTMKPKF